MATMAKAKKKQSQSAGPEMLAKGIRMTREYSDWLDRLADRERMSVSTLIDRAVTAYARETGFEAPPMRVP
jgi:predicted DNA-binding ribbon-helix-helix protein